MAAVPRNFKLLDELEEAEKSIKSDADISLGLSRSDDTFMSDWQASIFCAAGGGEARIWFLRLHCDKDYPMRPPSIAFNSRVTLECVDPRGNVMVGKVPYLASWNGTKTLYGALTEIKHMLARAPKTQPPDGTNY